MNNDRLHPLRQQLERCYSLKLELPISFSDSWSKRWQWVWRSFATFMVHKPQLQTIKNISQSDYARKVRFYSYLSPIEEERDWLEKSYRNSGDD